MLWFITSSFTIQIFVHYNISNDVELWRTALTTRQFQVHSGINHLYLRKIPWAPQARSISYDWNFIMKPTEPELIHCFEWRVYMDFHFVYVMYAIVHLLQSSVTISLFCAWFMSQCFYTMEDFSAHCVYRHGQVKGEQCWWADWAWCCSVEPHVRKQLITFKRCSNWTPSVMDTLRLCMLWKPSCSELFIIFLKKDIWVNCENPLLFQNQSVVHYTCNNGSLWQTHILIYNNDYRESKDRNGC